MRSASPPESSRATVCGRLTGRPNVFLPDGAPDQPVEPPVRKPLDQLLSEDRVDDQDASRRATRHEGPGNGTRHPIGRQALFPGAEDDVPEALEHTLVRRPAVAAGVHRPDLIPDLAPDASGLD